MYNQQIDHNEETKLLASLRSGSQEAFARIYRNYSARIYLNILKMIKSEVDAKELLQDVFFKVWIKRNLIDVDQPFKFYLFQIAKYTVYNHIRRKKLEKSILDYLRCHSEEGYTHIEEELLYRENEEWLAKAIEQLPPQRQKVFKLCKMEGKSYHEVSELLGISPSTINDHIVKATKFIREKHLNNDSAILLAVSFLLIDKLG